MNTYEQVVIISAERSNLDKDLNDRLSNVLEDCIQDINLNYKRAEGVYKGVTERSFVVICSNHDDVETLQNFAFKNFNQESILHQDSNGIAHLVYSDGRNEVAGRLRQRSSHTINPLTDDYTLMGDTYYTIERL